MKLATILAALVAATATARAEQSVKWTAHFDTYVNDYVIESGGTAGGMVLGDSEYIGMFFSAAESINVEKFPSLAAFAAHTFAEGGVDEISRAYSLADIAANGWTVSDSATLPWTENREVKFTWTVSAVPEPTGGLLLLVGGALLALKRKAAAK